MQTGHPLQYTCLYTSLSFAHRARAASRTCARVAIAFYLKVHFVRNAYLRYHEAHALGQEVEWLGGLESKGIAQGVVS